MQNVLGLAMSKLFNQKEEQYYLEKSKKNVSKRKIINFYHEVSKDVANFELRVQYSSSYNEPQRKLSQPVSKLLNEISKIKSNQILVAS